MTSRYKPTATGSDRPINLSRIPVILWIGILNTLFQMNSVHSVAPKEVVMRHLDSQIVWKRDYFLTGNPADILSKADIRAENHLLTKYRYLCHCTNALRNQNISINDFTLSKQCPRRSNPRGRPKTTCWHLLDADFGLDRFSWRLRLIARGHDPIYHGSCALPVGVRVVTFKFSSANMLMFD